MKKLAYILPVHLDHDGIAIKVAGQVATLNPYYDTRLIQLQYHRESSLLQKIWAWFQFEYRSFWALFTCPIVYIRYNHKTPFILLISTLLSYFKIIYIEHNTKVVSELRFLKSYGELISHYGCLLLLRFGKHTHLAVNAELQRTLIAQKLPQNRVIYCQNGYMPPTVRSETSSLIVDTLHYWASNFEKIAIFSGNGYPWHGIELIQSLFKHYPHVGIIVVGPYSTQSQAHSQSFYTGKVDIPTLVSLYAIADFAISTFRWDLLSITEGSPLKTRDYLCHGLPILTHYYDCAADFDALKPYIFNYQDDKDRAISDIIEHTHPKSTVKETAIRLLSWENLWRLNRIIISDTLV
jgi:hypothetical protein